MALCVGIIKINADHAPIRKTCIDYYCYSNIVKRLPTSDAPRYTLKVYVISLSILCTKGS